MAASASADTRRVILDAALALVDSRGIDALSIREVARKAGVTHQAPYHYFRDRAALLAAIALEGFVLLRAEMVAARDRAPARGDAQIKACGVGYVRFSIRHEAHFQIMFRREARTRRGELGKASAAALQVLVEAMVEAQRGGFAPAGNTSALVLTSWSTAHGLASLVADGALARDFGHDFDALAEMVGSTLASLLATAARAK